MTRINSHVICQYIDTAGDDPSTDWIVFADDWTGQEAARPVTDIPELINTFTGDDHVFVQGQAFMGGEVGSVAISPNMFPAVLETLQYFQKGATATTRPEVVIQAFDNTDDMLKALGFPCGDSL